VASFAESCDNPKKLSFRSAAVSREESAVLLPAESRFLASKPGFGMTSVWNSALILAATFDEGGPSLENYGFLCGLCG
jgi:hypothetical protein